jgi:hypothetical protein
LYLTSELVKPSAAQGLQKVSAANLDLIEDGMSELEDVLSTGDERFVIESLAKLIPDYKPSQKASIPVSQ